MQTKKCFKKGLGAASAGVSQVFAPCCTHCALLWFLKLRAMSFSNTYVKQLAGNSCGTSPEEVPSTTAAAASPLRRRAGAPKPACVPLPGRPSRMTWSALTRRPISTSSPEAPRNGFQGERACCPLRANLSRQSSWPTGVRAERVEDWCWQRPLALSWSISPSPSPPHCAKCWKRQLQYYCSEAHLLPALDGLALISIAVQTGASRVTSLGISYRVGFLYQLCYLLYTL